MLYILLPVSLILLFVICWGCVILFKKIKKMRGSGQGINTTLKVISFLFPLVGLIIYAVNVGKNDELATDGLKYALYGVGIGFIMLIVVFMILSIVYFLGKPVNNTIYGSRNDNNVVNQEKLTSSEEDYIISQTEQYYNRTKKHIDYNKKNEITMLDLYNLKYLTKEEFNRFYNMGIKVKIIMDNTNDRILLEIMYK